MEIFDRLMFWLWCKYMDLKAFLAAKRLNLVKKLARDYIDDEFKVWLSTATRMQKIIDEERQRAVKAERALNEVSNREDGRIVDNLDLKDEIAQLEIVKKRLLAENSRLSNEFSKMYAERTDLIQKKCSAEEQLEDERSGYKALDATNRSLEQRMKTMISDLFDQGEGMYMIMVTEAGEKTTASKSFRIPLKLQKKITAILTGKQKKTLKTKSTNVEKEDVEVKVHRILRKAVGRGDV